MNAAQSLPYDPKEFETVAEAEVDSRGRVSLGKAGAEPGRRYRVERNIDGVLILIPVVSIPEREMIVWRNPELASAIRQGIAEAEAGQTTDRGSFAGYAGDAEDGEDNVQLQWPSSCALPSRLMRCSTHWRATLRRRSRSRRYVAPWPVLSRIPGIPACTLTSTKAFPPTGT